VQFVTAFFEREDRTPAAGKPRLKEMLQRPMRLDEETGQSDKAAEWKSKLTGFDKTEIEKQTAAPKP